MLQVARFGYTYNEVNNIESSLTYLESGFNYFYPIEYDFSTADTVYFSIRKRSDSSGTVFDTPIAKDYDIVATDVSNGALLSASIFDNSYANNLFPSSPSLPALTDEEMFVIIQCKDLLSLYGQRVGTVDCVVGDRSGNYSIHFRFTISITSSNMSFMSFDMGRLQDRRSNSVLGNETVLVIREENASVFGKSQPPVSQHSGNLYLLLSPITSFRESDDSDYTFSYPINFLFYKREPEYNDEEYVWTISSVSHDFVSDNVKIFPVPYYHKVGVFWVDQHMLKDMQIQNVEIGGTGLGTIYADITATGRISGATYTFRTYFSGA